MRSEVLNFSTITDVIKEKDIFIIIDPKVQEFYRNKINQLIQSLKSRCIIYDQFSGEGDKNLLEYGKCIDFLIQKKIHRKARILAIGGGATSDFAGFVASTILRGVSWSVVPTTLLSMIDASIGGKTGLNTDQGKNLIGSFYLPDHIFFDFTFLETLEKEELDSGKGELIKYCLLDQNIYESVINSESLEKTILLCTQFKQKLVGKDFKEDGSRMFLNLGHTFGHAFEKTFSLPHGLAVLEGIYFKDLYFNQKKLSLKLDQLVDKLQIKRGLITREQIKNHWNQIIELVSIDKKRGENQELTYIRFEDFGKTDLRKINLKDLKELNE